MSERVGAHEPVYISCVPTSLSPELSDARSKSPSEKLREALDLARTGFELKRIQLRERFPGESDVELAARFARWLEGDDRPGR